MTFNNDSSISDPAMMLEAVRLCARAFVEARYHDEVDIFDLVWTEIRKLRIAEAIIDVDAATVQAHVSGIPFARDATQLVSPYAILTVETVLRELSLRGSAPGETHIASAVEAAAVALGASTNLARELREFLTPRLTESLVKVCEIASKPSQPIDGHVEIVGGVTARVDKLFVQRIVDGKPRKQGWQGRDARKSNRENPLYDIVVDEVDREVIVRDRVNAPDEVRIVPVDKITPYAAGMLWLALTNFGDYVSFKKLEQFLGRSPHPATNVDSRPKSELGRLLGRSLRDRLVGKPLTDCYPITRDQVNYCWLRCLEEPQESCLYRRIGAPAEDTKS